MQKYKVYINNKCKIITDNWESFCKKYTLIEAAGGLVYNSDKQILMIFRNGKWDLPKGKKEGKETIDQCALREVEEECGVNNLTIINQHKATYHVYQINDKNILKKTFWFKMFTNSNKKLTPQISEGIIKAEWISKENIMQKMKNSYANIKDLFLDDVLL